MPLLAIDFDQSGSLAEPGDGDALVAAIGRLPEGAPMVVMIHGYKFSPTSPAHSPHTHILSLSPSRLGGRSLSWPRHLGFGQGRLDEGLCIALGWEARGTLWQAYRHAGVAGRALARLIDGIGRPVDVLAHSLGARVALSAMARLGRGRLGRLILISGAEFGHHAQNALKSPAGRGAEVINVTSRENALFDLMFERLMQRPLGGATALGAGLANAPHRWLDLPIDRGGVRVALARLGYPIPAPSRRVCHWSGYMRPGLFALYASLIRERLPLSAITCHLPPEDALRPLPFTLPLPRVRTV
ncbi:MAG: hypothetical protein HKO95_00305 [Rhodobacteraceae bacterium]|nr:hypothetical protein [Paracoccaceae bacterium]